MGGLLRYGIPDFKLNKRTIDRRLKMMMAEGLEIKTGTEIGKDISGKELLEKYDALCLAIGAMQPRDLDIEGRDLDGIHFAMEYLTQQNRVNDGAYVAYDNRITAEERKCTGHRWWRYRIRLCGHGHQAGSQKCNPD